MRRFLSFAVLAVMHFPECATGHIPTGYLPYNHRYLTAKQYKIITKYPGDPYED